MALSGLLNLLVYVALAPLGLYLDYYKLELRFLSWAIYSLIPTNYTHQPRPR